MDRKIRNKQKVLIADDSDINRSILADMLGDEFEILEAQDGAQAIILLQQFLEEIVLVFLDIVMPEMDGFQVLAVMNKRRWIEEIPVIVISAEMSSAYIDHAYDLGVTDFISRPFDGSIVRRRALNTIMLYSKQKKLIGLVADQIYEKEKNNSLMVEILSNIVEFRNGESGLHVLHIRTMTDLLLKRLVQITDRYPLTPQDISLISTASALHDIGKIAIPEEFLNKPGRLTAEEFRIIKTHSVQGANLLKRLPFRQKEPLVKVAYEICRWHHERYDGRGYPDGLLGNQIPISAQIVALADVYDALSSERAYKKAFSHEKSLEMILCGECGAFNPLLLQCLTDIAENLQEQLKISSLSKQNQRKPQTGSEDVLRYSETASPEQAMRLLKQERAKHQFFSSISREIQFEMTARPEILTLSAWGAEQLGLGEVTLNPFSNAKIRGIFGEDTLQTLDKLLAETTPGKPMVEYDCILQFKRKSYRCRIIARSMWSEDLPPQNTGTIGKIIEMEEIHL